MAFFFLDWVLGVLVGWIWFIETMKWKSRCGIAKDWGEVKMKIEIWQKWCLMSGVHIHLACLSGFAGLWFWRGRWLLVSTEERAVKCSHHGCVWVSECPCSRGTKLPPAWGTSRNQCREKEAGRLLEVLRPRCEACSSLLHPQSFGKRASWTHFMPLKRAM